MRITLLVVAVIFATACRAHDPPAADRIPRMLGAITIDGDWDESDWVQPAFRGQFRGEDGQLARPSSEVRLLHDRTTVYVALYAADQDIESTDAFDLALGTLALHADAAGHVTPAVDGLRAAVGADEGTRDHPEDDDEEWVVELAIPIAATGLSTSTRSPVKASRCDVPKDGIRRCGTFAAQLALE